MAWKKKKREKKDKVNKLNKINRNKKVFETPKAKVSSWTKFREKFNLREFLFKRNVKEKEYVR